MREIPENLRVCTGVTINDGVTELHFFGDDLSSDPGLAFGPIVVEASELNRLRALNAELEREVIRLRSDLDGMTAAAESLQFDVCGVMDSTE